MDGARFPEVAGIMRVDITADMLHLPTVASVREAKAMLAENLAAGPSAFEEHRSLDIIEIYAASNNRVEDIRELRDTVRFPPQGAKKKVYTFDEDHIVDELEVLPKAVEVPLSGSSSRAASTTRWSTT